MAASRKNEWTHVTFDEIAAFIEAQEIAQLTFAKEIGVTNSTFHHWKSGKSVPSDEMQQKIAEFIGKGGKKKTAKKKATKKKVTTTKAETLDDLLNSSGRRRGKTKKKTSKKKTSKKKTTQKKVAAAKAKAAKKKAPKKTSQKAAAAEVPTAAAAAVPTKKKTTKTIGRRAKSSTLPTNGAHSNGASVPSERAYLVGRYLDHQGVDSLEEFGQLIETVNSALS